MTKMLLGFLIGFLIVRCVPATHTDFFLFLLYLVPISFLVVVVIWISNIIGFILDHERKGQLP